MSQQQQSVFIEVPREKATKSFLAKVAQAAEKLGMRPRVKTLCKLWLTPGETVKLDETSFSLVGSDNTVQLVIHGELAANRVLPAARAHAKTSATGTPLSANLKGRPEGDITTRS